MRFLERFPVVLPDTSIWIDHLRAPLPALTTQLERLGVVVHPFVRGELALGTIKDRGVVLATLRELPTPYVARHDEVELMIESRRLAGSGIGYVDAHLLASALLDRGRIAKVWTKDKRLLAQAEAMDLAFAP